MNLLSSHYKLQVNCVTGSKVFIIDAMKTEDFIIPKIPLSKYLSKLRTKKVNHKVKPFEVYFTFYNLSYHNNLKDLREQL